MKTTRLLFLFCALSVLAHLTAAEIPENLASAEKPLPPHALKVSDNHRFLVDATTGQPVFLLADTAWNLGALKDDEIDVYLNSRAEHGFNVIMFALNFYPQADEKNAYGEAAYAGADRTELNPEYFKHCDTIIDKCAERGMYVMLYSMWAGKKSGTMSDYTAAQLHAIGQQLGARFQGRSNVILCAGGEASPNYIDVERVNAMGSGLKTGCAGLNLVTVHPVSGNSSSKFFATSPWLDFYMSQGKSATNGGSYDAAALVLGDFSVTPAKPTMMAEHRYETGTSEDPIIQRRSLYQCVFAGGCGYAYGHDALWQMTPHTKQPWMLKNWNPGVAQWTEALDTKAVRQLQNIKPLLASRPNLNRIPDQSLILSGQGKDVASRTQAMRDGTPGASDATYLMAYVSAQGTIVFKTDVISSQTLNVSWFDPEKGSTDVLETNLKNTGTYQLGKRENVRDGVLIVDDASKGYTEP
jgi:hypothetical protein